MRQHRLAAIALAIGLNWLILPARADDAVMGPMPWPNSHDYYPPRAKHDGLTGRVGLERSVDKKGRARNVVILESGGPLFDAAVQRLFADFNFRIPADWEGTGGPEKRFTYGVIFRLAGKPEVAPFQDNRRVVVITQVLDR